MRIVHLLQLAEIFGWSESSIISDVGVDPERKFLLRTEQQRLDSLYADRIRQGIAERALAVLGGCPPPVVVSGIVETPFKCAVFTDHSTLVCAPATQTGKLPNAHTEERAHLIKKYAVAMNLDVKLRNVEYFEVQVIGDGISTLKITGLSDRNRGETYHYDGPIDAARRRWILACWALM